MRSPSLVVACIVAAVATQSSAQAPRARPPELDRLNFLIGEFRGEVSLLTAPRGPVKAPMNFTGAWDLDLDSSWVVARYDQTPTGRTIRGLLLFSWGPGVQRYLYYGVPNAPMEPTRLRGVFEGKTLVFTSDSAARFAYRETWEPAGTDTLITTLSYKPVADWIVASRAVLVRVRR